MGAMKELFTTGQDLQRQMASEHSFAPSFEELCEIQRKYLQLVELSYGKKSIPPREDQQ